MIRVLTAIAALALCGGAAAAGPPLGDQHPSYLFAATGETLGYRLYVPSQYDGTRALPLVVVLHGSNNDENSLFAKTGEALKRLAEQHGVIILAPRGYNAFGGYGDIYPIVVTRETAEAGASFAAKAAAGVAPGPPPPGLAPSRKDVAVPAEDYAEQSSAELTDARINQLSEQEVIAALNDVRTRYAIDGARIYLTGNSMGGVGAIYLAVKYPTLWAAAAPGGGPVAAWSYPFERLRDNKVAVMFVHGAFDEHANPHWSKVLADDAKAQGVDARFLLVEGGHHGDAWAKALPQIFDFFDGRRR